MYIRTDKPLMATTKTGKDKEDVEIITVKEAAQRLNMTPQGVEHLIYDKSAESVLDFTHPSPHDDKLSGPKYIVCNKKFFDYIERNKR